MKFFVLIAFLLEWNILPVPLNTLASFWHMGHMVEWSFMIFVGVTNMKLIEVFGKFMSWMNWEFIYIWVMRQCASVCDPLKNHDRFFDLKLHSSIDDGVALWTQQNELNWITKGRCKSKCVVKVMKLSTSA